MYHVMYNVIDARVFNIYTVCRAGDDKKVHVHTKVELPFQAKSLRSALIPSKSPFGKFVLVMSVLLDVFCNSTLH